MDFRGWVMNAVGIIEAAHVALESTGEQPGKIQNRQVVHWSYSVSSISAIAGAVIAIAAYVLGNFPLAMLGGVTAISNGISSFYLKKFTTYDTMEQLLQELTARIKSLAITIKDLGAENKKLSEINKKFGETPQNWKEQLIEGNKLTERAKRRLDRERRKNEYLLDKVKKMESVSVNINLALKEASNLLLSNTQVLSKENTQLKDHLTLLTDDLKSLEKIPLFEEKLGSLISTFQGLFDLLKDNLKDLKTENAKLQKYTFMLEGVRRQNDVLSQEITNLIARVKLTDDKIERHLTEMEQENKTLKEFTRLYPKAYGEFISKRKATHDSGSKK